MNITELLRESHCDKRNWGNGPWQDEPDKLHFVDNETDMDCLIVRNGGGSLCGYVAVEPGHSMHDKHYDEVPVDANGGLTYSDLCQEDGKICHVPRVGHAHNVKWFGFDCAHSGDVSPAYKREVHFPDERYRTLNYVMNEVLSLAQQLKAL